MLNLGHYLCDQYLVKFTPSLKIKKRYLKFQTKGSNLVDTNVRTCML